MGDTMVWERVDRLVAGNPVHINRPAGSAHPRYPAGIYPLDYGYLRDTRSSDGAGIDVWCGTRGDRDIVAAVVTVDLEKRDSGDEALAGMQARRGAICAL